MTLTEKLSSLSGELDAEIKRVDASISTLRIERRKLVGLRKAFNTPTSRKSKTK